MGRKKAQTPDHKNKRTIHAVPRQLSDWLNTYLEYTQETESPQIIHFWTGVVTIGGALRRQVWIEQVKYQYTPNFYVVLVGPPGVVTKSTSIRIGMDLLRGVKGVKFGPQSMTWQALTVDLEQAISAIQWDGKPCPMSCLTIPVGELGTFLNPKDPEMTSVLTHMWDGQLEEWIHSTKTQGTTTIINPWLNIIAATTPAWIKENFPDVLVGGGLTSRIVFVYGDTKRHLRAYPAEHIDKARDAALRTQLIADLNEIGAMKGPFTLTSEALEWGREWYARIWSVRPDGMASDRYSGYLARKQTHVHKLAMVLSAARSSDRVIQQIDLQSADEIMTATEADLQKVFSNIGGSRTSKHIDEIGRLLQSYDEVPYKQLYRWCFNTMEEHEFDSTLNAMIKADLIEVKSKENKQVFSWKGEGEPG